MSPRRMSRELTMGEKTYGSVIRETLGWVAIDAAVHPAVAG
jgi:hypothetical protein